MDRVGKREGVVQRYRQRPSPPGGRNTGRVLFGYETPLSVEVDKDLGRLRFRSRAVTVFLDVDVSGILNARDDVAEVFLARQALR